MSRPQVKFCAVAIFVAAAFTDRPAVAQWVNCSGTSNATCTFSGVGIGKTNPAFPLDVQQSSSGYVADFLANDGVRNQGLYLGVSATAPYPVTFYSSGTNAGTFAFDTGNTTQMTIDGGGVEMPAPGRLAIVANSSTPQSSPLWLSAQDDGPAYPWGILFATQNYLKAQIQAISKDALGSGDLVFSTGQYVGMNEWMRITSSGAVGIGTSVPCSTNPPATCRLSVKGGIQANEVVVNTGWSDYVFDPGYELAPLIEVAGYIQAHHHLPEIPSATEVEEKGVNVGDMQSKLLAKVEELTLYMIRTNEEIEQLKRENQELRQTIRGQIQ